MKKHYYILVLLLVSFLSFGQENQEKLKFHSNSFALNFYSGNNATGFMVNLDAAVKKGPHIFKAFAMTAAELEVLSSYNDNYYSFDLLYGREFSQNQGIAFDLFAGIGYYHFKTRNPDVDKRGYLSKKTIGFPLQGRLRFRDGKIFNLGIQFHANINNASSIISFGPFFQWNFERNKSKK